VIYFGPQLRVNIMKHIFVARGGGVNHEGGTIGSEK